MRSLLYLPIIHTEADMGSMAATIERESASLCGQERWSRHRETVAKFWQSVVDYLLSCDSASMKIYQDGLAADGEVGRKIIKEAARRGSRNHQVVLELIKKGAEIRKTEDASLLLQEYEHIYKLVSGKPSETVSSDRLTEQRDRFIASTINETLRDGEIAVLFIGAYHNVFPLLARDIVVKQIKDAEKVRAYFHELFSGRDETMFQQLAHYLTAPIRP